MKKLIALLLALLVLVGCAGGNGGKKANGQIIYGSTTEMNGDLGNAWWGNNASDALVRGLINDYSVIVSNQGGEFVENKSVTTGVTSEENADGSKTFTVGIQKGLKYNNGEPITAADFVAYALVAYSPALKEAGGKVTPNSVLGGLEYQNGEAKELKGVRLLDDYTYSITINKTDPLDPETSYLPYFFESTYASLSPLYLPMYASAALTVKDDGNGAYLDGGNLVASELDASRTIYEGRVSAGPYQLESLDLGSLTATVTVNPNYAGNFEGQKPSVEKVLVVKAVQETMMDQLETGAIDFLSTLTDGSEVQRALDMEATGKFKTVHYERNGYGAIFFQCDFGPTQFKEVRHAVAYLLDRNEFANTFCQGFGSVVDGPYGLAMWMYKEAKDTLASTRSSYSYSLDSAVEELKAGGWVLNEDGTDYVDGSGLVRWKEVTPEQAGDYPFNKTLADGRILMPLHIEWSSSEGNSVSELLAVMLANGDQTKQAGMEINQNVMSFSDLLNYYYRDASSGDQYGVKTYGMYNLATNFTAAYDQSYSYTVDPELLAQGYNTFFSVDNPTLDKLSMDMVYGVEAGDNAKYLDIWTQFIQEWNAYLPAVPLYSNVYYDAMNAKISNLECNSLFDFDQAVVYATVSE